jgi:site-specific recombinase XerC
MIDLPDDTFRAFQGWLAHLAGERRLSPKTLEAYGRDARQFFAFLTDHLGGPPTLAAIARLKPMDLRAFLASRRAAGVTGRWRRCAPSPGISNAPASARRRPLLPCAHRRYRRACRAR